MIYNKINGPLDFPFIGQEVITARDAGDRIIHQIVIWSKEEEKHYKENNIVAWATFDKYDLS